MKTLKLFILLLVISPLNIFGQNYNVPAVVKNKLYTFVSDYKKANMTKSEEENFKDDYGNLLDLIITDDIDYKKKSLKKYFNIRNIDTLDKNFEKKYDITEVVVDTSKIILKETYYDNNIQVFIFSGKKEFKYRTIEKKDNKLDTSKIHFREVPFYVKIYKIDDEIEVSEIEHVEYVVSDARFRLIYRKFNVGNDFYYNVPVTNNNMFAHTPQVNYGNGIRVSYDFGLGVSHPKFRWLQTQIGVDAMSGLTLSKDNDTINPMDGLFFYGGNIHTGLSFPVINKEKFKLVLPITYNTGLTIFPSTYFKDDDLNDLVKFDYVWGNNLSIGADFIYKLQLKSYFLRYFVWGTKIYIYNNENLGHIPMFFEVSCGAYWYINYKN